MRTVFMGSPEFAVPCLHSLHQHSQLVAVVCQPDKPAGRGQKTSATRGEVAAEKRWGCRCYSRRRCVQASRTSCRSCRRTVPTWLSSLPTDGFCRRKCWRCPSSAAGMCTDRSCRVTEVPRQFSGRSFGARNRNRRDADADGRRARHRADAHADNSHRTWRHQRHAA